MPSTAERFDALFAGLRRAFGQYLIAPNTKADGKGKVEGRASTWSDRPLELADWEAHLSGKRGLGICPLTDDDSCLFGAIDVDIYPIDPRDIYAEAGLHQIPLILCRSKSGGIHAYIFFSEPVPADLLRERLKLWATLIGHVGVEVYPKQDTMDDEGSGNWINCPYMGGTRSVRYAYGPEGALTIDEFLDLAESSRVTRSWLEEWRPRKRPALDESSEWYGGPPCLEALTDGGRQIAQGGRNNGFFNVCKYLQSRFGQGWQSKVPEYARHFDPPLRVDEMRDTIRAVNRRSYGYICDRLPCSNACDRQTCVTRPYGVRGDGERGGDRPTLELGGLQKILTEPPTWRIEVNGRFSVELTTEELWNQHRFWLRVMEDTELIGETVKPSLWKRLLERKLNEVVKLNVSGEVTLRGDVEHHLREFCGGRVRARAIDELLQGKPWTDGGRTYFVASDFFEYLHVRKVSYTRQKLGVIMMDLGMDEHRGSIKGKSLVYWSVPEQSRQTESFDVPKLEREEPF